MIRPSPFRLACSLIALSAVALAACAGHDDRDPSRRHVSIKDDPADIAPPAEKAPRAHKTSHVVSNPIDRKIERDAPSSGTERTPHPDTRSEPKAGLPTPKTAASEPAPVLPKTETFAPPVRVIVETPAAPAAKPAIEQPAAAKSAALEPRPTAPALPAEAPPVDPPKTTVASPEPTTPSQPSRPAVVIKPAEVKPTETSPSAPEGRPTADARRRSPAETMPPPRVAAVPPPPATMPPPPAAAVPAQPLAKPEGKADPRPEPKVATLTEDQRVAGILESADGYMKAGRFQNARSLLEDAGKTGNPKLLTALAETYDPLVLREQYPKLARTGDPEKAISLYEQAAAKGAQNLNGRITALKTLAGPKR